MDRWICLYLSTSYQSLKQLCLICQMTIAVCKVANIRRHHESKQTSVHVFCLVALQEDYDSQDSFYLTIFFNVCLLTGLQPPVILPKWLPGKVSDYIWVNTMPGQLTPGLLPTGNAEVQRLKATRATARCLFTACSFSFSQFNKISP